MRRYPSNLADRFTFADPHVALSRHGLHYRYRTLPETSSILAYAPQAIERISFDLRPQPWAAGGSFVFQQFHQHPADLVYQGGPCR